MLLWAVVLVLSAWLTYRSFQGALPAVGFLAFLAFLPLPVIVPSLPGGFELYEVAMIPVLALVLARGVSRAAAMAALAAGVVLTYGVLLGLAESNSLAAIRLDVRRIVVMVLAIVAGGLWIHQDVRRQVARLLPWLLWVAAILALAASTGLVEIAGRIRVASLDASDVGGATRLQIPPLYLSAAVLCGLASAYVAGVLRVKMWRMLFPAAVIVVLGFTRNTVLAISVAAVVAILCTRQWTSVTRAVRLGIGSLVSVGLLTGLVWLMPASNVSTYIVTQGSSFNDRVIQGLRPSSLANDDSTRFRLQGEIPYLKRAIEARPLLGHGFGYAYRPAAVTGRAVTEESLRLVYYAHNFYLWIFAKGGLIAGTILLYVLWRPVFTAVRLRSATSVVVVGPLAGLLVASVVAPMPTGSPTSLLLGLICGAAFATVSQAKPDHFAELDASKNAPVSPDS